MCAPQRPVSMSAQTRSAPPISRAACRWAPRSCGDRREQVEGQGHADDVVDGVFEPQGLAGVPLGPGPVAAHGVREGEDAQHVRPYPLLAVPLAQPQGLLADLDGPVGLAQEAQRAGEFDLVEAYEAQVLAGYGAAGDGGLEVPQRAGQVVAEQPDDADDVLGVGGLGGVAQGTGEGEGLRGLAVAPGEVLGGGGQQPGDPEAAGPFPGRFGAGGQGPVEPVQALAGAPQACQ